MNIEKAYTTGYIQSADGTKIGYRQLGRGPGLVLMHGGLQAAQSLMLLATALSDEFTVYIPDRRGRGLSGPTGEHYSIRRECEDLGALLDKTGAHGVFGLSSGALISLYSALHLPSIHKIALYEPALSIIPVLNKFMPRYEREIAEGKIVSAFITIIKGLGISPLLNLIPRFILLPFLKLATRYSKEPEGDMPLNALIPTFQDDDFLIRETAETFQTFENVRAKSLLMGGSKSPEYFIIIIKRLADIIPGARSMKFTGLDQSGPGDGGKPAIVAEALRRFFHASNSNAEE